jgi:hypothetical protein
VTAGAARAEEVINSMTICFLMTRRLAWSFGSVSHRSTTMVAIVRRFTQSSSAGNNENASRRPTGKFGRRARAAHRFHH